MSAQRPQAAPPEAAGNARGPAPGPATTHLRSARTARRQHFRSAPQRLLPPGSTTSARTSSPRGGGAILPPFSARPWGCHTHLALPRPAR